ncbi:HepT-like ribonuclease domain-containing protein, partial [Runella sp.]
MDNDVKTWLFDILNAINEIESFFIDGPKTFADYQLDLRTKRAVERNIEIIGEAMNRILKKDQKILISNSKKMVDVRNRIIHGYDTVSDEIIWGIVNKYVPVLQTEIKKRFIRHYSVLSLNCRYGYF